MNGRTLTATLMFSSLIFEISLIPRRLDYSIFNQMDEAFSSGFPR